MEVVTQEIAAIGDYADNAELIAAAGRLGYIEGEVYDLTFGEGSFWRVLTEKDVGLYTNDLHKVALTNYDFRCTPLNPACFDTVVFDPPYKLQGTPATPGMDAAFGTEEKRTRMEVHSLIVGGLAEAARLSKKWVLVKCQDQVSSGEVRWQTDLVTDVMRVLEFRKVDSLLLQGGRPQPKGRRQVHARRNYSSLLVFKRGR